MQTQSVQWSRVIRYVGITFAVTWGFNGAAWALGWGFSTPVALVTMWLPGLVALALTRVEGQPIGTGLALTNRPAWRWMPVALAWPLLIPVLANLLALVLPGISFDGTGLSYVERVESALPAELLADPSWAEGRAKILELGALPLFLVGLVQAVVAGATINALAALGEELGWRGYLHRVLAPLGMWRITLLVGPIWGLWHAPAVLQGHNYPEHPVVGVLLMVVFCTLLTPLHVWIRARTKSVWGAAWLHGTVNATPGLATMLVSGGNDLLVGATGLSGLLGLGVLVAVLYFRPPPTLVDETTTTGTDTTPASSLASPET